MLEEVFELNESLDELREARQAGGDPAEMAALARRLETARANFEEKLGDVDAELELLGWSGTAFPQIRTLGQTLNRAAPRIRSNETHGAHERRAESPLLHSQSGAERAKRIGGGLSEAWDARLELIWERPTA